MTKNEQLIEYEVPGLLLTFDEAQIRFFILQLA